MTVKIYHNPRCSKSRQTLELIRESGAEPEIIDYLDTPPDAQDIGNILKGLGFDDPRLLMRKGEAVYKELDLANENKSKSQLVTAMAQHPILIERPIVVTEKGIRLGRPPENVKEIL